jgi:hypothetical protein
MTHARTNKWLGLILGAVLIVEGHAAQARSVGDEDCRAKEYSINVIRLVQEALRKSGHLTIEPTGLPNKPTLAAIQRYRRERGLGDTDRIDPALLRALLGGAALEGRSELEQICDELAREAESGASQ